MFLGRPRETSYLYDAQGKVVRSVQASPWTEEDRVLMMAWRTYKDSLCPGCGHPKETAWHHQSEDSFDHDGDFVCWACTAQKEPNEDGVRERVKYPVIVDTRDYTRFPLRGAPQPISD